MVPRQPPVQRLAGAALSALLALLPAARSWAMDEVEAGRAIYEQGVLPDGSPLEGTRLDSLTVSGAQAACAQCHRSSGMGNVEGDIQVPPVTGNALFGGDRVVATMDPRSGKAFNQAHEPYSEDSLARAVRHGQRGDGRRMQPVMPRYRLDDAQIRALTAYLRQLSADWSPGVAAETIRFATVITPDVPPARRALFADMVRKIVAQKNGSTMVAGRGSARHHMASAAEFVLGTERKWIVDFWVLRGEPQTWAQQLDAFYARQPVFAVVSGLGYGEWGPVDAFCDRQALPCWFPSVDAPPSATPRYSIYFSRGVTLEAQLLADHLRRLGARAPKRLIQVFRDDHVGRAASGALRAALAASGIAVQDRMLAGADAPEAALHDLGTGDAVMFWLRPQDVARLESVAAPPAPTYFSARLAGAEQAPLPAAWKQSARLVYPYELPERRAANLAYFKAWLNQRHVPLQDEVMQSEVYFAFAFLTDTVTEMLDNLYRDYLIERAESMISRREGGRAEAEYYSSTQSHVRTQAQGPEASGPQRAEPAALTALKQAGTAYHKREGTSAYPRLALGPGQRFASKGGYIARFADGGALVADGDWTVP